MSGGGLGRRVFLDFVSLELESGKWGGGQRGEGGREVIPGTQVASVAGSGLVLEMFWNGIWIGWVCERDFGAFVSVVLALLALLGL